MPRGKHPGAAELDAPRPDTSPAGHLDDVAAAVLDAELDEISTLGEDDPQPGRMLDNIRPGEWTADEWGLPPGCPVLPLGTEDGAFYFLNTIGEMRALKGSELGQAGINELFMGRHLWLTWAFPKSVRDVITSWRPERVREVLMGACARKGSWSPVNRVRGRGMWRGRDGRLIIHCGDRLISARGEEQLGELEGRVYPTRPPLPRPWPVSLAQKPGPALKLLPHFQKWQWRRPELDPVLLIGWIGVAFLGGAAPTRPSGYVTGGKGTGKSALQSDLETLMGDWLVTSADTTAAGLYQLLKFDCLPVAVDEFEAKADNRKLKSVIELMRLSFSGGRLTRGSDGHKGVQFSGRSAFMFSSINMPPMEPQDLSRLARLSLLKTKKDAERPVIPEHELAELGRKVLRRLMDEWHRWDATRAAWHGFMASCGHDGRGQDTFGTLMAVADLVIAEDAAALGLELGPNAENFESWRPIFAVENLAETANTVDNSELVLAHLMGKRIEAWRGGTRHTIGELLTEFWERDLSDSNAITYDQVRKMLEQTGLALLKPEKQGEVHELLVPFNSTALYEVFRDTKWAGEQGSGAWTEALRQNEAIAWRERSGRINGRKAKGTSFRLQDIIVTEAEARA